MPRAPERSAHSNASAPPPAQSAAASTAFLDKLPVAACATDSDRRIVHCNRLARALLGDSFVDQGRMPAEAAANDAAVHSREVRLERPDGRVLTLIEYVSAIGDGRLHILLDHSAIAAEHAQLVGALREADRRKDEFLAVLAHELRNPLAPVRNAVQILRAIEKAQPELAWALDVIDRQVQQMSRLVDDLLDVSRIASGKIELRKERVAIADVVTVAVDASRPLMERHQHELAVRVPHESVFLQADPARLAQVLSNLLNNAAKFTNAGGHIRLEVARFDGEVEIRVSDDGVGIADEMKPRIFDMFAQIDRGSNGNHGGLGIGLTIVKRLVEMHGGTIEAKSDGAGRGSEFVVHLPVSAEIGITPPEESSVAPSAAAAKRILVVDDNRDAADSLSMVLRAYGHDVTVAYDGLEAVGAAVTARPEVALLDLGMPKLHGFDVARRIRDALGDRVLLIAITGWGQDEDRRKSREAGFDHHLTKPVEFPVLLDLIAQERQ